MSFAQILTVLYVSICTLYSSICLTSHDVLTAPTTLRRHECRFMPTVVSGEFISLTVSTLKMNYHPNLSFSFLCLSLRRSDGHEISFTLQLFHKSSTCNQLHALYWMHLHANTDGLLSRCIHLHLNNVHNSDDALFSCCFVWI